MPGKPVYGTINIEVLSSEDKKKSLESVNLIKEKQCVNIKGITCENGSRQKRYLKEYEPIYSPTCSTESLMLTLLIDSTEQRDVAVFDVTGTCL